MYEKIMARKSVPQLYEEKLIVRCTFSLDEHFSHFTHAQSEGVVSPKDISDTRNSYKSHLEGELAGASTFIPTTSRLEEQWNGIVWSTDQSANHSPETGVDKIILEKVGAASVAIPEAFV
jgi:probable 2-oxoglutarate dehydrogenase E1 component DHKTD1